MDTPARHPARLIVAASTSLLALVAASPAAAQQPTTASRTPPPTTLTPLATLSPWAESVWLAALDRDGAHGGRLDPDGVFQRFHALMDSEYELDVRTGLDDAGEDVAWTRSPSGFRARAASISHPHILNRVEWKQTSPVSTSVDLLVRYRREHSLTATRDYPWVGVAWRGAGGSPWAVSAGLGVHFFKPSADVEVGLARTWADDGGGIWTVDLGVAALDAFSNVIFNGLGVEEDDVEAHFDYRSAPLAARGSLLRASGRWLLELHAGSTTSADVHVTFPGTNAPAYGRTERVWFAGGLVQVRLGADASVAVHATVARADTDRSPDDGAAAGGFELREETRRMGARGRRHLGGPWGLEAALERVWRPEERVVVDAPAVDHDDREAYVELALARRPEVGWTARLGVHHLDRDAGVRAPRLTAVHRRLTMESGYAFASRFRVVAGVRWDLDHFGAQPFDGAHLRLTALW